MTDAKRYFSNNSAGHNRGKHYLNSKLDPKRQHYLETAIRWISQNKIEEYMSTHKEDASAEPLWRHFERVVDWIEATFTVRRNEMKGQPWGVLYDTHRDDQLDPDAIEAETHRLMQDDEVQKRRGIYLYILTRDEKHLNLRSFPDDIRRMVYEKQNGECAECGESFDCDDMEADHITPWIEGGKTVKENCQMLCRTHNRRKGAR